MSASPAAPSWVTLPSYGPESLTGLLGAAISHLGIVSGSDGADNLFGGPPPTRGIVLVLADGLGLSNLQERSGHAPFLNAASCLPMRVGFPSTTVASLGSLGTGLAPGRTGLAGYSLRDPFTGKLTSLIGWETDTDPRTWQPHPTHFERLDAIGRPASFIGEKKFEGSAMTRSSFAGARFYPAAKRAADRIATTLEITRSTDGLVYLYWGELDKIGHAYGWRSPAWSQALEILDSAMRQLAGALPSGWELFLTADHGMVDVSDAPQWDVAHQRALQQEVSLVAGEARAVHVYTPQPEAVAERWQALLEDNAWVLTKTEAIEVGLFGSVDERTKPYLGDVIVAMAGRATVLDSRTVGQGAFTMVGHHGSLTRAEMIVPLLHLAGSQT
jgi:predicted AlkP superfamily pyrophosphatase or phosphodiesterase